MYKLMVRNTLGQNTSFRTFEGTVKTLYPRQHFIISVATEEEKLYYESLSREGISVVVLQRLTEACVKALEEKKKMEELNELLEGDKEELPEHIPVEREVLERLSKEEILKIFSHLDDEQPRSLTKRQLIEKMVKDYGETPIN